MNYLEILKYYSREDIQNAILSFSKNREIVGSLRDGSYLNRPDVIEYPKDIIERVKKGAVAFHCSVERWLNPMQLSTNLTQKEIDSLRIGFDLIIDVDAKAKIEHAIVAAKVIYNFLKDLGIKPTLKFSGSRGFHIAISYEAFPEKIDFKETSKRYPEIPQTITEYLREEIKEQLLEELIALEGGVSSLVKTIPSVSELSPYEFVEIEKGWSNRHLFRMPFSLHHKKWLVSVPLSFEDLKHFKLEDAKTESVKTNVNFLTNKKEEATELLLKALDWKSKQPKEVIKEVKIGGKTKKPIAEEHFPPCIKLILSGLKDGRKRSLFTLITFLRNMNWKQEDIEKRINEWNMKNSQPLSERFVKSQLKWHFRQNRILIPANCTSSLFYEDIGICKPDKICELKKIKNPINYSYRKIKTILKAK